MPLNRSDAAPSSWHTLPVKSDSKAIIVFSRRDPAMRQALFEHKIDPEPHGAPAKSDNGRGFSFANARS